MKKRLLFVLLAIAGCQTEHLDIRAPYRIKLSAVPDTTNLKVNRAVRINLNLQTDSYYSTDGYQLVFYQQTGLGRLRLDTAAVPQQVAVPLALGASAGLFTPAAAGTCQVVLIARQERGYTPPDTVRLNFQVNP